MNDWVACECCEAEFKIISDNTEDVAFCPYCGEPLEIEEEDDEEFWEDEY